MLIEVSEIHPPKVGGKVARIVAADGERYEIWPDKLAGVAAGKRYDVETTSREFNGRTFKSIKTITPLREEPQPPMSAKLPTLDTSPAAGEAEYVGRVLAALIIKGEINGAQIANTTARLRKIWREADLAARPYREEG
jgi:hypothetical protein